MYKKLLFGILGVLFIQTLSAQVGVDVGSFVSPARGFNYNSNAIEDIEVRILNEGPVVLVSQDSIRFKTSISVGDSTTFYVFKKQLGQTLSPNERTSIVLFEDYNFSIDEDYVICVSVTGTDDYPSNTTKNASNCVSFIVGIEDQKIDIENFYYSNSRIYFDINNSENLTAFVYDLTGKTLLEKNLTSSKSQSLGFSFPAKGFYFIKVQNRKGQYTIKKFIAN